MLRCRRCRSEVLRVDVSSNMANASALVGRFNLCVRTPCFVATQSIASWIVTVAYHLPWWCFSTLASTFPSSSLLRSSSVDDTSRQCFCRPMAVCIGSPRFVVRIIICSMNWMRNRPLLPEKQHSIDRCVVGKIPCLNFDTCRWRELFVGACVL